jgi:hypothetical protein
MRLATSEIGTFETCRDSLTMSAHRGKADIPPQGGSPTWVNVSKEPLLISVPDSGGHFYLLLMIDMWTDIFAVPGKRTTGTGAQLLAIAGPGGKALTFLCT